MKTTISGKNVVIDDTAANGDLTLANSPTVAAIEQRLKLILLQEVETAGYVDDKYRFAELLVSMLVAESD